MWAARINVGNRNFSAEGEEVTAYTANNLNQYTSVSENDEEAFVPRFDADGNQTLIKTATGIWSAVYNAENRPVSFSRTEEDDTVTLVSCAYDSEGRRCFKKVTVNGTVTLHERYIYRGYLQIAAVNLLNTAHPLVHAILWDPTQPVATRLLAIRKGGSWHTYGWDLTKNICELFASTGALAVSYAYSPYGAVIANGDVTQPIQWSNEYADGELGLAYYNYRLYNLIDGRWMSRDPYEENAGFNLFYMCNNTPIMYADYLGLDIDGEPNSGFQGFVRCERFFLRKEIKAGKVASRVLTKIGIDNFKLRVAAQYKKCSGCCKGGRKSGISKSFSIFGQLEGEGGKYMIEAPRLIKLEMGWYLRLGTTISISGSKSSCNNSISGSGCVNLYGEAGLIARASTSIASINFGARGGLNLRGSICISTLGDKLEARGRLCASLRARVWAGAKLWPIGKFDFNWEHQFQICTPWWTIFSLD